MNEATDFLSAQSDYACVYTVILPGECYDISIQEVPVPELLRTFFLTSESMFRQVCKHATSSPLVPFLSLSVSHSTYVMILFFLGIIFSLFFTLIYHTDLLKRLFKKN